VEENARQRNWLQRRFDAGDDSALLYYFGRHVSGYRRRTATKQLPPCTLTAQQLVQLFHRQGGRCYYTGISLKWNNLGVGKGRQARDSMSVDRIDPDGPGIT